MRITKLKLLEVLLTLFMSKSEIYTTDELFQAACCTDTKIYALLSVLIKTSIVDATNTALQLCTPTKKTDRLILQEVAHAASSLISLKLDLCMSEFFLCFASFTGERHSRANSEALKESSIGSESIMLMTEALQHTG